MFLSSVLGVVVYRECPGATIRDVCRSPFGVGMSTLLLVVSASSLVRPMQTSRLAQASEGRSVRAAAVR